MNVKAVVERLIKKHKTCSPFKIAEKEKIRVFYHGMGEIFGNYIKHHQTKIILIDKDIVPPAMLDFVCAHELGHAVCTPNMNTLRLKLKHEYEAVFQRKR